jgi:Phosphatase-1 catalytic subunit binding region.
MRKVTFNEKDNKIHILVAWQFAYNESRKRYWETFACDRERFQRKIAELSNIINPVLNSSHRHKIYIQRFCVP